MTQVSGSISLELGKVVRETTRATLEALLTRQAPEGENVPLDQIGDAVADRIMVRLDRDLGGVLVEIRTALARIETLVSAEAQRRERLDGPATGEIPVLNPDGRVAYEMSGLGRVRRAQEAAPGMDVDPVELEARADARLAQARVDGPEDSWFEEEVR